MPADSSHVRVRVHALGGFRIVVAGRELRLRTRKEAMVLLALALRCPRRVRRDELVAMLWPDSSEARARHSLSEALRGVEQATGIRVEREADTLALTDADVWTDVRALRAAVDRGDLDEASRLYVGGFLAGWYPPTPAASHWVDATAAEILGLLTRMARSELNSRRRATDSRGVTSAVALLERLGAATDADREAAAEAEQITSWESIRSGDPILPRIPVDREGPFVGRTEEMKILTAELDRALAGELRVVLVPGEAGIGKTRTCQRVARLAALRGARLFLSSCYELEQSVAFGAISEAFTGAVTPSDLAGLKPVWQQVLGEVLPEVVGTDPAPLVTEGERPGPHSLLRAFASLFDSLCERRTGLLLVDDIQWADSSSCQLLHYLLRCSSPKAGAIVLLPYRAEELPVNASAELLIRNSMSLGATVGLGPMARQEIQSQIDQLCPELSGDRTHIASLAEGNPFFARELTLAEVSHPAGQSPRSLRDVVLDRVSALPEPEKAVLELLAVGGTPMSILGLARVLQEPITQTIRSVAALDSRRLIKETGAAVVVAHDIIRDAIYSSLSESMRRSLHAAIATSMEQDASPSFLAVHNSMAGIREKARQFSIAAAQASRGKRAFHEEIRWLTLAAENSDDDQIPRALRAVVDRQFALGRYSDAVALLTQNRRHLGNELRVLLEIARLKTSVSSTETMHQLILRCDTLFSTAVSHGMAREATDALREKMRFAQEAQNTSLVLSTAHDLDSFGRSRSDVADGAYARAIALLKLTSFDPVAVGKGLSALSPELIRGLPSKVAFALSTVDALDKYNHGQIRVAGRTLHDAIRMSRSTGDLASEVALRALLVPISSEAMRFQRAERHAAFVFKYSPIADASWERLMAFVNLAMSRWERGDVEGARSAASSALNLERSHPMWLVRANLLSTLGLCSFEGGRFREAAAYAQQVSDVLPPVSTWISDVSFVATFLATEWRRQGRSEAAIEMLRAACHQAADKHRVSYWMLALELAKLGQGLFSEGPTVLAAAVRREAAAYGCRLAVAKADRVLVT